MRKYFTSESVTNGHPDKVCDQIADAILDELLKKDADSRVAIEVAIKDNFVFIFGEVTSKATVDYKKIATQVLSDIGYGDKWTFKVKVTEQSSEIASSVVKGAGDQCTVFGYACNETPEKLPLPISLANKLAEKLTEVRKELTYLKPDGKVQVTVAYEGGTPVYVSSIVISNQTTGEDATLESDIQTKVVKAVVPKNLLTSASQLLINPAGSFTVGGFIADSGLTGRKIMCDTYGGYAHHGGGSFSGKDATKLDRSAAYMARYIAKLIVESEIASKCEVQLSYIMGQATPVVFRVDTFGTASTSDVNIMLALNKLFRLTPPEIIKFLDLKKVAFLKTATFGHFGREFSWEKISAEQINRFKDVLRSLK